MRTAGSLTLSVVAFVLITTTCFAHQNVRQACEVPLVVMRSNKLVRDLDRKDLTVRLGTDSAPVEGFSIDSGPKRIALVLDSSTQIPAPEWTIQLDMASSLVEHARPQDTFSLFLVGASDTEDPISTSADVRRRLKELASSRPVAPDSTERIYDALLAAIMHLTPSQFGDAIFLVGHDKDSGSKVSVAQLKELTLRNRVRLYGLSFYNPFFDTGPPGLDPKTKAIPFNGDPSELDLLSHETGYFVSFTAPESLSFPGQIRMRKDFIADLYAGIAEPFRVSIPGPSVRSPVKLEIDIANLKKRKISIEDVRYPRSIYPCVTPPPSTD